MFVSKSLSGLLSRKRGIFRTLFCVQIFPIKCKCFIPHISFFSSNGVNVLKFSFVTSWNYLQLGSIFIKRKKKERKCIPKTLHGKKSSNNIKSAFCGIQTTNGHYCESWSDFALWHTYFCIVHCMYSPCNMKLLWICKKKKKIQKRIKKHQHTKGHH